MPNILSCLKMAIWNLLLLLKNQWLDENLVDVRFVANLCNCEFKNTSFIKKPMYDLAVDIYLNIS